MYSTFVVVVRIKVVYFVKDYMEMNILVGLAVEILMNEFSSRRPILRSESLYRFNIAEWT